MSFHTAPILLTLLVVLINVFSSKGSDLPKKDRLVAGYCLKNIVEPLFANDINREQTTAQFLGTFCTLDFDEIQNRYQEQNPEIGLVKLIKGCLKLIKEEHEGIFDFYKTIGISLLGPLQPESETSAGHSKEEIMISSLVSALTLKPKNSEFFSFAYGLCKTSEFVDYAQLEERADLAEAFNCCTDCATNFFNTIYEIFMKEINDAKDYFLDPTHPERAPRMKELPNTSIISRYDKFKDECVANEVNDFKSLDQLGIFRLQEYERIFKKVDKIYATVNFVMDEQLANTYFDYNSCIRWGCALNTENSNNVPFANWFNKNIEEEKNDPRMNKGGFKHTFSRVLLRKCGRDEDISKESTSSAQSTST